MELGPGEADALGLFLALDTQWRRCALSGARLGLDYQAIEPVARMLEIKMMPGLLADLRIMERAALEQMARQK